MQNGNNLVCETKSVSKEDHHVSLTACIVDHFPVGVKMWSTKRIPKPFPHFFASFQGLALSSLDCKQRERPAQHENAHPSPTFCMYYKL